MGGRERLIEEAYRNIKNLNQPDSDVTNDSLHAYRPSAPADADAEAEAQFMSLNDDLPWLKATLAMT